MSQTRDTPVFDSLAYWRARHEQYLNDPRGVGNVEYDALENELIYQGIDTYIARIVTHLDRKKPVRVLELGCGTGMLAGAFIRTRCEYTGIDISEKAIEIARAKHKSGRFEVANIAFLPLNEKFDIIIERTVFIHLVEDAYWHAVIKEVMRLLASDGVFILMDHLPTDRNEVSSKAPHVKFRLYSEYGEAFRESNLRFNKKLRGDLASKISLSPDTHFVTHS